MCQDGGWLSFRIYTQVGAGREERGLGYGAPSEQTSPSGDEWASLPHPVTLPGGPMLQVSVRSHLIDEKGKAGREGCRRSRHSC